MSFHIKFSHVKIFRVLGVTMWQVKALFQGKLQEKMLSLTVSKPPPDEMAVRGDPNRLRQVCQWLIPESNKPIKSNKPEMLVAISTL